MADEFALTFVALGDSLTVGFQPPDIFLPGREEFPYTRFLEIIMIRELPRKGLGRVQVSFRNAGILGDTVRGMLERFDGHVVAEEPDHVIVWGGINDIFMLRNPDSIAGDLKRIYSRAFKADIGPIACTVTSVLGQDCVMPQIMEVNQLIRRYCEGHGVPLADLFEATSGESGRLRETFSSDGVHLSQAGYRRVAHTIYYEVIEDILDKMKR